MLGTHHFDKLEAHVQDPQTSTGIPSTLDPSACCCSCLLYIVVYISWRG